jgi:integrase/recombinase XerD
VSVATSAKALRAFFQYAGVRGWCAGSIASGIDGPRLFQHEGLPVGPCWPDVQRLIASSGGDSPRDVRDRAILILLATYGFRSGEVAGLCLENVNWEREIISIVRPKQRRAQEYPLVSEAGEAILLYLQRGGMCCIYGFQGIPGFLEIVGGPPIGHLSKTIKHAVCSKYRKCNTAA